MVAIELHTIRTPLGFRQFLRLNGALMDVQDVLADIRASANVALELREAELFFEVESASMDPNASLQFASLEKTL